MTGDFNVTRTSGDRSSGRAITRDSRVLNKITLQAGLIDVFIQCGRKPKCTYFCAGRSSRIDLNFVNPTEIVGGMSEKVVSYSDHMTLHFCLGAIKPPNVGRGLGKHNLSLG